MEGKLKDSKHVIISPLHRVGWFPCGDYSTWLPNAVNKWINLEKTPQTLIKVHKLR